MKLLFYDLFILCFEAAAWLISPFNMKSRLWLKGRVNWAGKLQKAVRTSGISGKQVLWLHAASLGEFEQGRPVLDALKAANPALAIVITFFSPSGYEVLKNYKGADIVTYLPTDTPANARTFIKIVQPSLVLWVKYDYWYHHLKALHRKNIPVLLVSAIFWSDQVYFKWYGGIYRSILPCFTHYFMQNETSADLLKTLLEQQGDAGLLERISVNGDTRFDRVIDIAENWIPVLPVENWLKGETRVLVAGSTWPEDEEELVHFVKQNRDIKVILAPHQVDPESLKDTIKLFGDAVLFSDLLNSPNDLPDSNLLIINNVGLLSRLYRYGYVSYVGGGFSGSGIHNVLEAAVYGVPVLHGPDFEKYQEAVDLNLAGGSFVADNALQVEEVLGRLFNEPQANKKAAEAAEKFVFASKGSTRRIIDYIHENRLLTSL